MREIGELFRDDNRLTGWPKRLFVNWALPARGSDHGNGEEVKADGGGNELEGDGDWGEGMRRGFRMGLAAAG